MADKTFEVFLNPLAFLEVDEPWATDEAGPDADSILRMLCTPGLDSAVPSVTQRYREISTESVRLFAAPNDQGILEKLVWPLRHAKAGYMIGNYLGTIALCGMVAEMAAILFFEIAELEVDGKPLDESAQKQLSRLNV